MATTNPLSSPGATPPHGDVTQLLEELASGREESSQQLFELIYDDLKKRAHAFMRKERQTHTLQTTALVHEAYMDLAKQRESKWANRGHFLAIASTAMRRILVDHARARAAGKRGADYESVPFEEDLLPWSPLQSRELLALNQALEELEKHRPRASKTIELRFFGGMTQKEVAAFLKIDERTVGRDWRFARAWLNDQMKQTHR